MTPRLQPGDKRMWTALRVFFELREGTVLQIPFREASKVFTRFSYGVLLLSYTGIGLAVGRKSRTSSETTDTGACYDPIKCGGPFFDQLHHANGDRAVWLSAYSGYPSRYRGGYFKPERHPFSDCRIVQGWCFCALCTVSHNFQKKKKRSAASYRCH